MRNTNVNYDDQSAVSVLSGAQSGHGTRLKSQAKQHVEHQRMLSQFSSGFNLAAYQKKMMTPTDLFKNQTTQPNPSVLEKVRQSQ